MLREFFKNIGRVGMYLLALFVPFMGILYWCYLNISSPLDQGSTATVKVFIDEGATVTQIAETLEAQNVIRNAISIWFITNFRMTEEERTAMKITAGEYELGPGMRPREVLQSLMVGKVVSYDVVIPPGTDLQQAAEAISTSGLLTAEAALTAMKNSVLMQQIGLPAYIPEGYMIEGTYSFTRPGKAEDLIAKLIPEAEKRLDGALPEWKSRSLALGFQPYDILKIASLIERTTSAADEREVVASVYHNRLRIGMPLQSDLALAYGAFKDVGQITEEDRKEAGPYNTYLNTGLPLTPICSPSIASIEAALNPKDTDFLYMVPTGEGAYDFSSTLKEHKKKEKQYRDAVLGLGE